jgi:hypothetical protein
MFKTSLGNSRSSNSQWRHVICRTCCCQTTLATYNCSQSNLVFSVNVTQHKSNTA